MSGPGAKANLFEVLANEAMMAILVLDDKNDCIYANNLARDLFEFSFESDLSQFKIDSIFVNETDTGRNENKGDHRISAFGRDILELQGNIQEILVKKLNSHTFVAAIGIKQLLLDGRTHKLIMFQDITLQKKLQREITEKQAAIHQAYQELLKQNRELKQLDLAKNRFIAMTTHELRTPLSAVLASAEILKLKIFDKEEEHDEFVNTIYDQANHLLSLVNDILDFAKIQANKMDYYVEQNNIYSVLQHEVHALLPMAEKANVTINLDKCDLPLTCYFDDMRIRQVLTNLINNAIKYNRTGGTVDIHTSLDNDYVTIEVADTGNGIAPDDHEKIFNEFETLGKIANHSKGTGLGLPISKRLIESMGGTITLTSTVGVGSQFFLKIPRNKVLAEENYRSRGDQSGDLAA